jgi:Lipoprotein LpqB beta-propeller domain
MTAPSTPRRLRALLAAGTAAALISLLGGCAQLAAAGGPVSDNPPADTAGGADVRIWAQTPSPSDNELQIVEGFIQAAASGQTAIAQAYLSPHVSWDSGEVLILANPTAVQAVGSDPDTFFFTGTQVGSVDAGAYAATAAATTAAASPTSFRFHVRFVKNEGYRIDVIPPGFGRALTQDEFNATFATYGLEYITHSTAGTGLIPVIRHLPATGGQTAVATSLAASLFTPPPQWLGALPVLAGVDFRSLSIDQTGTARVTVDGAGTTPCVARPGPCNELAAQMMATFSVNHLGAVNNVQIYDTAGDPLGNSDAGPVDLLSAGGLATGNPDLFYLNPESHQVYEAGSKNAGTGPPAFVGTADSKWSQLAVGAGLSGGSPLAAVVDAATQTKLYIGTPGSSSAPVLRYSGGKISSLSWDEDGNLWFLAVGTNGAESLYRLDTAGGTSAPARQVPVLGLPLTSALASVSIAPDGNRIAVAYTDPGGGDDLAVGMAQDLGDDWSVSVDLAASPSVIQGWYDIAQVVWYDGLKLAVLGESQQASSPDLITELYADGWPAADPADDNQSTIPPQTGAQTTGIAWASGGSLLAYSADQVFQFNGADNPWNFWGAGTAATYAR